MDGKPLRGKGVWIWKLKQVLDPEGQIYNWSWMANELAGHGFSHVLVKILDGTWGYNQRPVYNDAGAFLGYEDDLLPGFVDAMHQVGVVVYGWQWVMAEQDPAAQGKAAGERCKALGLDGYVCNAEAPVKGKPPSWLGALVSGVHYVVGDTYPCGLSSYRYPNVHQTFPWKAANWFNFAAPQVYWEQSHNAGAQLAMSVDQYREIGFTGAIWPTGAAYPRGSWYPTPADVAAFAAKAEALFIRAINYYRWGDGGVDELPATKDAIWQQQFGEPVEPPPPPVEEPEDPELARRVTLLEGDVSTLEDSVGALNDTQRDHEKRITALEDGLEPLPEEYVTRTAIIKRTPRANAHFEKGKNANTGKPIMVLYPSPKADVSERIQFTAETPVPVFAAPIVADGGVFWQLAESLVDVDLYLRDQDVKFS